MSRWSVHNRNEKQKAPKEGTALRRCYDRLFENKGKPVEIVLPSGAAEQLNNFYGLDVQCIRGGGKPKWILKGAFINGRDYVNFMEEVK